MKMIKKARDAGSATQRARADRVGMPTETLNKVYINVLIRLSLCNQAQGPCQRLGRVDT